MRTPTARQNIKDSFSKVDNQIFGNNDPLPESGLSRFSPIQDYEALELQLKFLPQYVEALSDLNFMSRAPVPEKG